MKIGEKLYKYQGLGKLSEYIVTGILTRNKLIQYELECQNCQHGYKCLILVRKDRSMKAYIFCGMVNDDEDYHECFHTTYETKDYYYPSLDIAKKAVYQKYISSKQEEINNTEKSLELLKTQLQELKFHFDNIDK